MPTAFLNDGATSMAAANWSDGLGVVASAQLVIRSGTQSITNDVNYPLISIESLDVEPGFSGFIASQATPFTVDIDGTAENPTTRVSRLRYFASGGECNVNASGPNTLAHFVEINTGGRLVATGGILKNVVLQAGRFLAGANVLATGGVWRFSGGTAQVDYAAAAPIPQLDVLGGQHKIDRNATTLNAYGGFITIDCASLTITTLTITGGQVRLLNSGTITTVNLYGGTLDCSSAQRPITFTTMNSDFAGTFLKGTKITIGTENVAGAGPRGRNRI
jgi:hypothetical protein